MSAVAEAASIRAETTQTPPPPSPPGQERLHCLDALRGFDMFWLIGGKGIVLALTAGAAADSWRNGLRLQFEHVAWEGFRFYDFIFPLFLFTIGMAVPLSVEKRLAQGVPKAAIVRQSLVRYAWMFFFGLWVTGRLLTWNPAEMRLGYSVLQMLGFGYLIAVALVLWTSLRTQIAVTAAILAGYWALQMFVPVPGQVQGQFEQGAIFSDWVYDNLIGEMAPPWKTPYGRGWPVWMWTCGATAMLGVFATRVLRQPWTHARRIQWLAMLGVACLAAGWIWSWHFPIVKNRWTSTYVLWSAGWSFLLIALFYWVADVKKWRKLTTPFAVIGANSMLAYLIGGCFLAVFATLAKVLFGGLAPYLGWWHPVLMAVAQTGFVWLLLADLYRRRIFLRV